MRWLVVLAALAVAAAVSGTSTGSTGGGGNSSGGGGSGSVRTSWPAEAATQDDPTSSSGPITPRTLALLRAIEDTGMTGQSIRCHAPRPENPSSDHPKGKACDVMFNPHSSSDVAEGWRLARWLVRHQAQYGVKYVIWDGKYWSMTDPRWVTYRSDIYGCPNTAELTGCHYDHVHVSVA